MIINYAVTRARSRPSSAAVPRIDGYPQSHDVVHLVLLGPRPQPASPATAWDISRPCGACAARCYRPQVTGCLLSSAHRPSGAAVSSDVTTGTDVVPPEPGQGPSLIPHCAQPAWYRGSSLLISRLPLSAARRSTRDATPTLHFALPISAGTLLPLEPLWGHRACSPTRRPHAASARKTSCWSTR